MLTGKHFPSINWWKSEKNSKLGTISTNRKLHKVPNYSLLKYNLSRASQITIWFFHPAILDLKILNANRNNSAPEWTFHKYPYLTNEYWNPDRQTDRQKMSLLKMIIQIFQTFLNTNEQIKMDTFWVNSLLRDPIRLRSPRFMKGLWHKCVLNLFLKFMIVRV